ncbi:MAG: c-type cytochrome [Deltaproteobacteria bacterium]
MTNRVGLAKLILILIIGVSSTFSSSCNKTEVAQVSPSPLPDASASHECRKNPAAEIPLTGVSCAPLAPPEVGCYLPSEVEGSLSQMDFSVRQRAANIFSWQEFIALMWPSKEGERGIADPAKKLSTPGARVWETWKEEFEIYLRDGREPPPWNSPEAIPDSCKSKDGVSKRLFRTQKIDDILDSTIQAAGAQASLPATLTDEKGGVVRYEIRLNKVMFDYIVRNKLYDGRAQSGVSSVSFPDGAILVKAAWREVGTDNAAAYYTTDACLCDEGENGEPQRCKTAKMGLVGFHITQKTPSAPQWVWSTFEQVNNAPDLGVVESAAFYNPLCEDCPVNRQTKPGVPNQIQRVAPVASAEPDCSQPAEALDNAQKLNSDVQAALANAGSVLKNYELINTQWPLQPTSLKPSTVFMALPPALANTTMETFVQPTSTCVGCHSTARTVSAENFVSSDFSFTLNNAMPKPKNDKIIPTPKKPETPSDKANWEKITLGYALATETYERLPANVPTAKLHCSSCHLGAGANSDAAWWVDLSYAYKTKPELQARINGCFERSMNGVALCAPAAGNDKGDCDENPNMEAFLAYMNWLDEQWDKKNPKTPAPHGFPPIETYLGDPWRGNLIFQQKCAVCHGADGEGRYEGGVYFRPALWGEHSFNKSAGMFAYVDLLAAFIRWNMPLGAGGLLTDDEAWDVAVFIDSKPRSGKGN